MTLKTISEKAKSFTFTYYFCDQATAQVAGHALLGYMTGTYAIGQTSLGYCQWKEEDLLPWLFVQVLFLCGYREINQEFGLEQ